MHVVTIEGSRRAHLSRDCTDTLCGRVVMKVLAECSPFACPQNIPWISERRWCKDCMILPREGKMAEIKPLSGPERDEILRPILDKVAQHAVVSEAELAVLCYEATVAALEDEVAALRSRLACAEDDAAFCNAKRNEAEAKVARLCAENKRLEGRMLFAEDDASFTNKRWQDAEAEVERLQADAEAGRAVEGMPIGWHVAHYLHGFGAGPDNADDVLGAGPTALAALRAAKGEGDA